MTDAVTQQKEAAQAPDETRLGGSRAAPAARIETLDICRGLAILAVLFIHVSGHFLPVLHPAKSLAPRSWAWYGLVVPNQAAQWAVPCFLMLSAFVNGLGLMRGGDLSRYARRRIQTALLPYLWWSGVFLLTGRFLLHRQISLAPDHVWTLLWTGKAAYHLYFFVLVLEMYLLLPILRPLFRRRPPFWQIALPALALQACLYFANRYLFYRAFEGTILWHILPVALGLWLMGRAGRLDAVLNRGRWAAGVAALAALSVYLPLAIAAQLPHSAINTMWYQFASWGYTASFSLLMLALAGSLGRNRFTALLAFLGAESLAIYVMHPFAIYGLDTLGMLHRLSTAPTMLLYYSACLLLPLLLSWLWKTIKRRIVPAGVPAGVSESGPSR